VRAQPGYFDGSMRGQNVRIVSMAIEPKDSNEEVIVQVAETLNKRRGMMTEILLAVLLPQILLVFIGGAHVWIGINRGLRPLHALTREISQRSPKDLSPIADAHVPLEVRSLTSTINRLLGRLETAIAGQQRLIANAAHQFRTPVAGLKVQVERLLREVDPAEQRSASTQIHQCADRVSRLTSQLLALARSEAAWDTQRSTSVIDLADLIREVCVDWVPKALRQSSELSFDGPKTPLLIRGDDMLLRELLHNLLDNAMLYGAPNGQINVRLTAEPEPTLSVENEGPALPVGQRERVLERFYRIPGSPGDGCGLGLSIVREIADLHGAMLDIGAVDGESGTRVRVRFPSGVPDATRKG
jgi:two-component system sensor histidine kinase TctE